MVLGYKVKWVEDNLGVTRKALRVFEKANLMPENKDGQYRDYDDDDIDRIWTIRVLQKFAIWSLMMGLISILLYLRRSNS